MVGFGGTCTASPSLARRAVVVRASGQGPRGSGRSKDHLARRASETTSDAEAFDQERARERRIEEKFRGKSSARGSVRRGGEEALPFFEGSLLPEPKEALESYSSSYRVRQPGVQAMSPEEPRAPFPSSSAVAPDEPVYVKRRGRGHGRRAGTGGGGSGSVRGRLGVRPFLAFPLRQTDHAEDDRLAAADHVDPAERGRQGNGQALWPPQARGV